ncbi:type II secretion system minor pseudopilin GspI [Vibrio sp. SS-MA-C1-2]|uniref:type II secretion system minor pseudopilin GspI n=1 Tax=Vibrio sp. SS-MA-C1-2 TaxID=2908646 RepID=UPI001F232891|nr:type II secretion system minor pseudopilin GspI [Vibrio sp. SS-MA-C1-2]UJF19447.1 type II secretion system minor pseudopilin GspI [Vibrio sp. SS-MA-C1-2]
MKRDLNHSIVNHRKVKRSKGFTLIEVLVALAIFATATLAIMKAVSQHINTLGYLEDKTFASWVADNQMAQTLLDGDAKSSKKGSTELAGQKWYWQVQYVDTTDSLLKGVEVSVRKNRSSKSADAEVMSYVAN